MDGGMEGSVQIDRSKVCRGVTLDHRCYATLQSPRVRRLRTVSKVMSSRPASAMFKSLRPRSTPDNRDLAPAVRGPAIVEADAHHRDSPPRRSPTTHHPSTPSPPLHLLPL